jgi:AsmA protein
MDAQTSKKVVIAGGVVALILVAIVTSLLVFDIGRFKPDIESAAFDATGLEVTIRGKMGHSFFPFGISAQDVHIAARGSEIISMDHLKLGAELMPLLMKQLKVTSCEFVKPVVTVVKGADGTFTFAGSSKKSTESKPGASFRVKDIKLTSGNLVYLDQKTGVKTEFDDFDLAIKDLSVAGNSGNMIENIAFTGTLDCKEVRNKDLVIGSVRSDLRAGKGVIRLAPLTMDIFGGKGEGAVMLDKSAAGTVCSIDLKVSQLDLAKLQESFGTKKTVGGKAEMNALLTIKEKGHRLAMSRVDGTFSLRGDNLVIHTMDLDKVLSAYETSQELDLVTLGAYFIAGPLSSIALKGYQYGDVFNQTRGGQGTITHFISQWKISDGVADAADCALATSHNRVALTGKFDLVNERYDTVVVALLDDKGCAKLKQSISGPFSSPRMSAMSRMETFAAPIYKLYRETKRLVQSGNCEVFYHGAVRHPSQ